MRRRLATVQSALPIRYQPERRTVAGEVQIFPADYANTAHMAALIDLLDAYALDPMGGGHGLSADARTNLPKALRARPQLFSVLAWDDSLGPVGLVNCVEGFSTFACKPLVNVHDVVVLGACRGQGVAGRMLELVGDLARERGACKLTLEVLSGNASAIKAYRRYGFDNYELDPAAGQALFMQKWLAPA